VRLVGILKETFPGERSVAIVPRTCDVLKKADIGVIVEKGAGLDAGYPDDQYITRGATVGTRAEVFERAEIIAQVRSLGANPQRGREDLPFFRPGQIVLGLGEPLTAKAEIVKLRFFAGLENREIAEMLGISERTVERAWRFAKAWLLAELSVSVGSPQCTDLFGVDRIAGELHRQAVGVGAQTGQETGRHLPQPGQGREKAQPFFEPVAFFFEDVPRQERLEELSDAPSTTYISEFLASSEGLSLTRAFMRIQEPKLRRRIVDLVEAIAGQRER
jgi:hypothetical protein